MGPIRPVVAAPPTSVPSRQSVPRTAIAAASLASAPMPDSSLVAIEAGATAVVQPGGSMRDNEVIEAADAHGIAMVFTGTRHFKH